MDHFFQANKELWDARTAVHKESDFYDLKGFLAGKTSLNSIELEGLGDVSGKRLLHLQCHFGQDTLSWARLGAEVTGIDLSSRSIELARQLSTEISRPARFIETDLYSLPQHLSETFDIVFTSYGSIVWLPDLDRWAEVVAQHLSQGGTFYIADFHPTLYMYDFPTRQLAYHYFNRGVYEEMVEGTYADPSDTTQLKEYFWNHSLSEIIQALIDQGLSLLEFREFDYSPYNCFENMVERAPGEYVFTASPQSFPHVFSLKLRKG
jgi:SAM-dependent methyltransferase